MLQRKVDGIRAPCAVTDSWSVALSPDKLPLPYEAHFNPVRPWVSAAEAMQLLESSPSAAEARARLVLEANPFDPQAKCLLAATFVCRGRPAEARAILEPLSQSQPQLEYAWRGLGQVLASMGERAGAIEAYKRAIDLEYRGKDAWYALGSLLTFPALRGESRSGPDRRLAEVESSLAADRIEAAEMLLRAMPQSVREQPAGLKLRADVLIRKSCWPEAKLLLKRCLDIAPDFLAARFRHATMLFVHGEFAEALPHIDELLKFNGDDLLLRAVRAIAVALNGDYAAAIDEFEYFIANCDSLPGIWHEYGKVLRWNSDRRMSDAFRRAVDILPSYFAAYYALGTVKTFRWDEALLHRLRCQLGRADLAVDDRALMHFVLGKALEDLEQFGEAFENYRASKKTLRSIDEYSPRHSQTAWRRTRLLFNPAFLRRHAGVGCPARDPIFVVGMPRAGSTLAEQILSTHSQVEGLGELSTLPLLVEQLYRGAGGPEHWPMLLQTLKAEDFRALGEEYMRLTRAIRKTEAPFFTDKLPNNFQLSGLIHLILPNARIIDVRRHPLDCGFSCFKHHFPKGHRFASDLGDIGRRYVDYVEMMAHFDQVLPGKVHRLIYEALIRDFEPEVRRLLEFLQLPFESECLRFFENRRTVMTLSYEQVFMPLYESGIGHWRHYGQWLGPLKDSLGCVLQAYPAVPKFFVELHARYKRPLNLGESSGRFATMKGLSQRPFVNVLDIPAA